METYIRTFTGQRVVFGNARPVDIRLVDIMRGLSHLCRFGGQIRCFYSVAQHSVHVSERVPAEFAVHGLLHDAAEAYVGDVVGPLKVRLSDYREIEDNVTEAIFSRFGITWTKEAKEAVKEADLRMLATEMRDLRLDGHVDVPGGYEPYEWSMRPWSPNHAFNNFRTRASALGL